MTHERWAVLDEDADDVRVAGVGGFALDRVRVLDGDEVEDIECAEAYLRRMCYRSLEAQRIADTLRALLPAPPEPPSAEEIDRAMRSILAKEVGPEEIAAVRDIAARHDAARKGE